MIIRKVLCAVLVSIGLAVPFPALSQNVGDRSRFPTKDGVFVLHIQTDKQVYHAGETILVSVSVENVTDQPYAILPAPVCEAVHLNVSTDSGTPVPQGPISCGGRYPPGSYHLNPGAVHQLYSFLDDFPAWVGLWQFGYTLAQKGTYEITGSPHLFGFQWNDRHEHMFNQFFTLQVPRSNTVRITIE